MLSKYLFTFSHPLIYIYFAVTLELIFSSFFFSNLCFLYFFSMNDRLFRWGQWMSLRSVWRKILFFLPIAEVGLDAIHTHEKLEGESRESIGLKYTFATVADGYSFLLSFSPEKRQPFPALPHQAYLWVTRRKKFKGM